MTSAMQMLKTPPLMTVQDEWTSIFPHFATLSGSRNFIKKLMVVSLSAITYMRGVFPDRAYGERHLCGIKLKILTQGSKITGVDKFIHLIKSCYDAIDKKYLCQLSIGICTDKENKDEVLEAYHLNFRYRDDEFHIPQNPNSIKLDENDPTVESTLSLLKNIFLFSDAVGPLPKNAYLTMKLLYNDEITPPEYQPPGFEPSKNEKFFFPTNAVKVELGKVSTDLHGYKMYIKTTLSKEPLTKMYEESVLTDSQRSISNVQIDPVQEHMEEDVMAESQLESQSNFIEDSAPVKEMTKIRPPVKEMENNPVKISCPCACKQDSETGNLTCLICGQKQHAICYGILRPEENASEFYCIDCKSEAPTRSSQQDILYTFGGKEQQDLCAMRRALVLCASVKQITASQLEKGLKCKKELARDLIERLEFERFIRRSGQKFIVNEKRIINNGYCEYFPKQENKENMNSRASKAKKQFYDEPNGEDTTGTKRKPNFKKNKQSSEEQFMDFDLDKVRGLNLKDPFENPPTRRSRRSLKTKVESDDSEDAFKPAKRRCTSTRSPITLE